MLKKIIIIRHGEYDSWGDQNLNEIGKRQINNILPLLVKLALGKFAIISSTMWRARQSAYIIWGKDNTIDYSLHPVLAQKEHPAEEDFEKIWDHINYTAGGERIDTVVVVTHGEYTGDLTNYITKKLHKRTWFAPGTLISKGALILLDLEKEDVQYFEQRGEPTYELFPHPLS